MEIIRKRVKVPIEFKPLFEENKWRNLVFYGGRSSGKSHDVALSQVLRAREKRLKFLNCREFQNSIKDSTHALVKAIIFKYGFETEFIITNDSIKHRRTESEWIFKGLHDNVESLKSIPNIDEAWVEEASTVTKRSITLLKNTVRKDNSRLIFTFNRDTERDPVYVEYVMKKPEKTYAIKVNYDVLEKNGLFPDVMRIEMENDKKNNPQEFAHTWLGEPLSQIENAILSRDRVLNAMDREIEDDGEIQIGVDVARLGDDRSVLWKRKGLKTIDFKVYEKLRTNELVEKIEQFARLDKEVLIKIDDTGVGGGVTDQLLAKNYNVQGINFAQKAVNDDKYPNWISEAWFYLQEVIDEVQLPNNTDLLQELTTRTWNMDKKGKRAVESKGDYKKRGNRSPDLADSCILCYYTPPKPKPIVYAGVR
nr:MAG TPA: large terminase [Caudoviricetes sp.]